MVHPNQAVIDDPSASAAGQRTITPPRGKADQGYTGRGTAIGQTTAEKSRARHQMLVAADVLTLRVGNIKGCASGSRSLWQRSHASLGRATVGSSNLADGFVKLPRLARAIFPDSTRRSRGTLPMRSCPGAGAPPIGFPEHRLVFAGAGALDHLTRSTRGYLHPDREPFGLDRCRHSAGLPLRAAPSADLKVQRVPGRRRC